MARQYLGFSRQGQEYFPDGFEEQAVVAAGKIRAPDGLAKQGIAAKEAPVAIEADSAGGVPRGGQYLQGAGAKLQAVPLVQQELGGGASKGPPDEAGQILPRVGQHWPVPPADGDGGAQGLMERPVGPDVVDVTVGIDDVPDF